MQAARALAPPLPLRGHWSARARSQAQNCAPAAAVKLWFYGHCFIYVSDCIAVFQLMSECSNQQYVWIFSLESQKTLGLTFLQLQLIKNYGIVTKDAYAETLVHYVIENSVIQSVTF
jgi:hypothetical protein